MGSTGGRRGGRDGVGGKDGVGVRRLVVKEEREEEGGEGGRRQVGCEERKKGWRGGWSGLGGRR